MCALTVFMDESRNIHRAWLVDVDGTLYFGSLVKIAMAAEMLLRGWRTISVIVSFRKHHELLRRERHDEETDLFQLQVMRTAAEHALEPEIVRALVEEWMFDRPCKWIALFRRRSLLREIRQFKRDGGLVGIVSDYPAKAKLATVGLVGLVDVIVANGEEHSTGRLKPSPAGYHRAALILGVQVEDCLVIGDRADADGAAAEAAGMTFRAI
jgi:HAD superfamily hydrolase (TIGR01549 family)